MSRDEFSAATKRRLAQRVGYYCSYPGCSTPQTIGAARGHDDVIVLGIAAHITAAAEGGPRYDPSLTSTQRRSQENGIWLCTIHGKAVDSDDAFFTVERLHQWKEAAECRSLPHVWTPNIQSGELIEPELDTLDMDLVHRLGLSASTDLAAVTTQLLNAARSDLETFQRGAAWPVSPVFLNLRLKEGGTERSVDARQLATAAEAFNEITMIGPPGSGKTITLLQTTQAILTKGNFVATFIPLPEWSSQPEPMLPYLVGRHAYAGATESHLQLLAHFGRLILVLDGWNQLDAGSQLRAGNEVRALQRQYLDIGILLGTRREGMDAPIGGPVAEIGPLSENQQLAIGRATRSADGESLLDHAWRTPGVRELVAVPLYLRALLANAPGSTLPATKEEILRLFVAQHEQAAPKAEALRQVTLGFHADMMRDLAIVATSAANTTIQAATARAVVARTEDRLASDGQITLKPQPVTVLDALVSHHILTANTDSSTFAFQHQQFQEWYASFEVEALLRATSVGEARDFQSLAEMLNAPNWEEAILFACERVSRADAPGVAAVSATVLKCLSIDPLLAAEMIYRSSDAVWAALKHEVLSFVRRWHVRGKVDRAVRFMITAAKAEFADEVWPLVSEPDTQVHLAALRAGRRFRPTVLGPDLQTRLAVLPDEQRAAIIAEIAHNSGMDGIELTAALAKADPSPDVQSETIEAFLFRRAERAALDVLRSASDEVWARLSQRGYSSKIEDPQAAERLALLRRQYVESDASLLSKLRVPVENLPVEVLAQEVGRLIESPDLPIDADNIHDMLARAHELYPEAVNTALVHRLEKGLELPWGAERLLQSSAVIVDAGPLTTMVLDPAVAERIASAAETLVGQATTGKLIDILIALDQEVRRGTPPISESLRTRYCRVRDGVLRTPLIPFVKAVLDRGGAAEPHVISLLSELVALHGKETHPGRLAVEDELFDQLVLTTKAWMEKLLADPSTERRHMADVAQAIRRLPDSRLVPGLSAMLAKDLAMWRTHDGAESGNAAMSWTLQYQRAFAAIGGEAVASEMIVHLPNPEFGVDAACVLRELWERAHEPPKNLASWTDFSEVGRHRAEKQSKGSFPSLAYSEAMFAVIEGLLKPDADRRAHGRALELARIAYSLPHGDRTATLDALLAVPGHTYERQHLLTVLVLTGEVISADQVMRGLTELFEAAKAQSWVLDESRGELEGWVALMPFTNSPMQSIAAVAKLPPNRRAPWQLRSLLSALAHTPSHEAEQVLAQLALEDSRFLAEHEWLNALHARRTLSSARTLLDLITDGKIASRNGLIDSWSLSRQLVQAVHDHPEFRRELYERYESAAEGTHSVLALTIAEAADAEAVLVLLRGYASRNLPFDGLLANAVEHVAVGQRPMANWAGAFEQYSQPVPELRKQLFACTAADDAQAALAAVCLTTIDDVRDRLGHVETEPRHPDIASGRPWPNLIS